MEKSRKLFAAVVLLLSLSHLALASRPEECWRSETRPSAMDGRFTVLAELKHPFPDESAREILDAAGSLAHSRIAGDPEVFDGRLMFELRARRKLPAETKESYQDVVNAELRELLRDFPALRINCQAERHTRPAVTGGT